MPKEPWLAQAPHTALGFGPPPGPDATRGPDVPRGPDTPHGSDAAHGSDVARGSDAAHRSDMPQGSDPHGSVTPPPTARRASPSAGGLPVPDDGRIAPLPHPRHAARALRGCAAPTAAAVLRDADAVWRAALLGRLERPRRRAVARALERDEDLPPRAADALRELLREAADKAAGAAAGTAASTATARTAVRRWTRWLPWMS
jgi:hypothetical protein